MYINIRYIHYNLFILKKRKNTEFAHPKCHKLYKYTPKKLSHLYTYYIIIYLLEGVNFNNLLQKKKTIYFKGKKHRICTSKGCKLCKYAPKILSHIHVCIRRCKSQ